MKKNLLISYAFTLFSIVGIKAQGTFTSVAGTHDWSSAASWTIVGTDFGSNGIPDGSDNVVIAAGTTIEISSNQSCTNLTVGAATTATLRWTASSVTLTVDGTLTTNTCSLISTNGSPNLGNLTVNGNWSVPSARTTNIGDATSGTIYGINISMPANTLTVTGTLGFRDISNTGTAHTFNNVTISAGTWTVGILAQAFTINGNIANTGGTFTSGNGKYTLTGSGKTLSGNTSIEFKNELVCDGTYTNNNTHSNKGVVVKKLTGIGTFSQGTGGNLTIQAIGDENYDDFSVATFNASASGNTVIYSLPYTVQIARTPNDNTYHNLTFNGNCNALLQSVTNINGNLTIAVWDSLTSADDNFVINLKGSWVNSSGSGPFLAKTGTVNFTGTSTQNVDNVLGNAFYNVTCTGTSTVKLSSNTTISNDLTINSGATFDLNTNVPPYTLTVNGNFTNSGTFYTQNSSLTVDGTFTNNNFFHINTGNVYVGGNFVNNSSNFTAQTGKVTLNGGSAQTISGSANTQFYNLDIDNNSGVAITSNQSIKRTLTLLNSTPLAINGGSTLTLISDPTFTARIGEITGATITGDIIMQRYLPATLVTGYRNIGAPVTATVQEWIGDFPTSGFTGADHDQTNTLKYCSIQIYNESKGGHRDSGYVNISGVSEIISPAKGFSVFLGNTNSGQNLSPAITIGVKGTPGYGDINAPVTFTNSSNVDDGWNLISNPYPSDIDWDLLSAGDKTATDGAMHLYNTATGSYVSYKDGVSIPNVGGIGKYIPSSAAFFVKATTNGNLSFHENAKADTTRAFYAPKADKKVAEIKLLRLIVTGNGSKDEAALRAQEDGTPGYDAAYDAHKIPSRGELSIATTADGADLVINAIKLSGSVSLPIRVKVPKSGTYVIAKGSNSNWDMSGCTILEDLLTGTKTDLRTSSYSFTIADSTNAPRFVIHLTQPVSKTSVANTCFGKSAGIAVAKGIGSGPFTYVWKNSKGEILQTTANVSTGDSLKNLPAGVYTVEIAGGSPVCGDVAETITIEQPTQLTPGFEVSPVTCAGGNTGSATAVFTGGTKPYSYKWSASNIASPTISELAKGEYTVVATDANNCSATAAVTVKAKTSVTAAFTPEKATVYLVEDYGRAAFKNDTKGTATYSWNFGDGDGIEGDDALADPEHYYAKTGVYKVRLVARTADCADTVYKTITVKYNNTSTIAEIAKNKNVNIGAANEQQAFVTFDYAENNTALVNVQNILGQSVIQPLKITPNNQTIYLDLNNTTSKILIISVTTSEGRITKKIIR